MGVRPNLDERGERDHRVFERLFECSPDAIAVVDPAGRIERVNAQAEAMFGYRRDEMIGNAVEMLLPERFRERHAGHRESYLRDPRLRPMGAGLELFGRRKDASEFPLDILLSPVEMDGSRLVLAVARDVTERRRFEQTLREKNRELERAVSAKDRFFAGMSHELRTPLNAIIGFTGTLLMKLPGPLTADQDKQLHTIQGSARHLLSLINDLLDFAKIESGRVEIQLAPVRCREVIEDVVATLRPHAEGKGLRLEVDLPGDDVEVRTDRRALGQIVSNLAANAIKFTDAGEVRIELRQGMSGGVRSTEIEVQDTCRGILLQDQGKLFEPFTRLDTTSDHQGAGLGLYLSRRLAELIGARIAYETRYRRGSKFTVILDER